MTEANKSGEFPGHCSTYLNNVMNEMAPRMEAEEFERQKALIGLSIFEKFKKTQSHAPGPIRASLLHVAIDKAVAQVMADEPKLTCRRGCSHCCHTAVMITEDEAKLLAGLIRAGAPHSEDLLALQAARTEDEFLELSYDERACTFLTASGECGIYGNRPMACRKYYVTSPPEDCKDINGGAHMAGFTEAELIFSGALNVGKKPDILPRMLAAELKQEKQ